MLKKSFFMLAIVAAFASQSNAQSLKYGIRGGLNTSFNSAKGIMESTKVGGFDSLVSTGGSAKMGFHAGFFLRAKMLGILLEPELRFSSVNSEIVLKDVTKPTSVQELQKYTQSFQKIDLPLMVGFKAGPVRINAGPVGTIVVSSKSAISELADYKKYEEKINTASWGFQAGAGMDFGKLGVDLRYEGGLSKLGNGVTVAGQTRAFDQRQRQVILSLSYMIKND